jgi:23S rRNA (cytosine1962-C5)-methyltransferase
VVATVSITRRGDQRLRNGHPWIYKSDVARVAAAAGDMVQVRDSRGHPAGHALFSDRSEIALRMFQRGPEAPTLDTWRERLRQAFAFRDALEIDASAFRLVHGEADLLPSLVVDRYGDYLVVQALSQATDRLLPALTRLLVDLTAPAGILARNDPRVRLLEGLEQRVEVLYGTLPETVEVREGRVTYEADLFHGQKTGLFLDQRENHLMARSYAQGRVLDGFTYAGGFALQAASVGADVLAVDSSADALALVARNAARNGLTNVAVREANLFDLLRELGDAGERFDTVILDPPAFAKSKDAIPKARRGYKDINLRALRLLKPGGCLITCSCSYHIHEADLEEILAEAAADARATVAVVEKRRQARDHPVLLGVPETYYLKCFVLRKLA